MEKIIFAARDFNRDLGTIMHYNALCDSYGKDNVIVFDFFPGEQSRKENYVAFGKYKNPAERLLRWAQGNTMFLSNKNISEICDTIRSKDIKTVFIERPLFGKLVLKIKKTCPGVRTITFYHDINAILYPQWIKAEKSKKDVIEYKIGIKQEKLHAMNDDVSLVLNKRDSDLFRSVYGKEPEGIVHLSAPVPEIPESAKAAVTPADHEKSILFVGAYYTPNLIALDWFCENVLPHITAPVRFDVVGRGLEKLNGKYSDSRVNIIGCVDDLGAYYRDADIVIAPLFDGGGMKQKTVEALSYGKLFIGTDESLFGYREEMDDSISGSCVFVCNTADEWIQTLNRLGETQINKYNETLFRFFLEKFSYESQRDVLLKYVRST